MTDGSRGVARAHRLSWEFHYGPVPIGFEVCHHCDNPPCVRPDHLFLGTQRDNLLDARAKGRLSVPPMAQKGRGTQFRGERHYRARVTEAQVREIRARYVAGETTTGLGREFGLTRQGIRRIVTRRAWRHVA